MPLINCEIYRILNWFRNCVIIYNVANQNLTFAITETKLYVKQTFMFSSYFINSR